MTTQSVHITGSTAPCGCADLLGKKLPYGPMLAEHCILNAGLAPARHPAASPLTDEEVAALAGQLQELDAWLDRCKVEPPGGFILLKPAAAGGGGAATVAEAAAAGADGVEAGNRKEAAAEGPRCPPGMMYDDFDPLRLQQKADKSMLEFASFDAALDEFYSKVAPSCPIRACVPPPVLHASSCCWFSSCTGGWLAVAFAMGSVPAGVVLWAACVGFPVYSRVLCLLPQHDSMHRGRNGGGASGLCCAAHCLWSCQRGLCCEWHAVTRACRSVALHASVT